MSYGYIHSFTIEACNLPPACAHADGDEEIPPGQFIFHSDDVKAYLHMLVRRIRMRVANMDEPYSQWVEHMATEPFKQGVSANIFIETSNISVHACDPQRTLRVCIFTCKEHDTDEAVRFSEDWWQGECCQSSIREIL